MSRRSARIRTRSMSQDSETDSESDTEQQQQQQQQEGQRISDNPKQRTSMLSTKRKRKQDDQDQDNDHQLQSTPTDAQTTSNSDSDSDSDDDSTSEQQSEPDRKRQKKEDSSTHAKKSYSLSLDPGNLPSGTSLPSSSFLASLIAQRQNKTAELRASLRGPQFANNTETGQDSDDDESSNLGFQDRIERQQEKANALATSSTLKQLSILRQQEQDEVMGKSVVDNIDKMQFGQMLDPYHSKKMARKLGMDEQHGKTVQETSGKGWFDMPATQLTPEIMQELKVLRMRGYLDPKRHYKSQDSKKIPKFFQIGTWVESKADFYSSRIPKKQRKTRLVDELLEDAKFRSYAKKKFKKVSDKAQKVQKQNSRKQNRGGKRWRK
eukprot:TRINITY_DN394_c0_g2_i1.p1 TRINITY_DN394_c0_g2~~TRINITY_DN394_c0_g2_i1.p1  ORF type:complete len:379 (-),score=120.72 TRINITY_DN394_c0_g2_i1:114-1250(-)